jgi:hypothetical protein
MAYRCVARSVAGFVQQLAVGYVANGYYFYVAGLIPPHKEPAKTDAKIIEAYDIAISKWTRARRKREGHASVHYLRHRRFYVIIASHGLHQFFAAEATRLCDIRRQPICFQGYSIGCRRARGDGEYHASVRISRERFAEVKARFQDIALHRTAGELGYELGHLPFEPYAPVRCQLGGLLRFINRRRRLAGLELVPLSVLRWHRSPTRPFEETCDVDSPQTLSDASSPNKPRD